MCFFFFVTQNHGPEARQRGQEPGQSRCPPSDPFPESSLTMDQKPMFGQGYAGPPAAPSMGMRGSYNNNPMQGQSPRGFNPMMNPMSQTGGLPGTAGMQNMGNPRANMMRPRMMATKPLRLQLQQRLQGQQVTDMIFTYMTSCKMT